MKKGYTLIEVFLVAVVVVILFAILVPTFQAAARHARAHPASRPLSQ